MRLEYNKSRSGSIIPPIEGKMLPTNYLRRKITWTARPAYDTQETSPRFLFDYSNVGSFYNGFEAKLDLLCPKAAM